MKRVFGFSLVEMLISMAILGILLAILSGFLISNQRLTSEQITAVTLENDSRLAFLRMSEVIAQAQYIFPQGQPLILGGQSFTIGTSAIAVLVPAATTYCQSSDPGTYCGYAFTVESRAPFATVLGSAEGTSGLALVETFVMHLSWPVNTIPAQSAALYTWTSKGRPDDFRRSPITDSVDSSNTDLFSSASLASYNDFEPDKYNFSNPSLSNALLNALESKLHLRRTVRGKNLSVERSNFVFSRAIPRNMLPN